MSDPTSTSPNGSWTPRIVAFFCNWCTYTAADLAGVSRMKYAANARVIRLMCSGRVDPQFILDAFRRGADGVLIGGCHPGDCHYVEGNYKMLRRFQLLKRLLRDMGIAEQRVRLEWISAAEGERVRTVMNEMTAQLTALGPLGVPEKFAQWDQEVGALARQIEAQQANADARRAGLEGEAPAEPQTSANPEVAHV
jgi:F420-non-reducing hydrogenase iron-sulfur subunit